MPNRLESESEIARAAGEDDLGVQDYLDAFAQALTSGDAKAIAEMWETPAFVIGDEMAQAVQDQGEVESFFAGVREQYNSRGITDTRAEIVRVDAITDKTVIVRVRWPYLDADGEEIGGEASTYTLQRDAEGEWKIRVVVMHGVEAVN